MSNSRANCTHINSQFKKVPIYKHLGSKIGNEKFIEMLKEAAAEKSTESVKSLLQGKPGEVKSIASMLKTNLSNPP